MIYIREAQFLDEIAMNRYNLMVGAHLRGEEVKFYQSFAEIDKLTADDYVFDYVQQSYQLFEWMGLTVPLLDYPVPYMAEKSKRVKLVKLLMILTLGRCLLNQKMVLKSLLDVWYPRLAI